MPEPSKLPHRPRPPILLPEKAAGRDRVNLHTRRKQAGFPTGKTFGDWHESKSPTPRATQDALRSFEWVGRLENFCTCGTSGPGKSRPTEALGRTGLTRFAAGGPWLNSGTA